MLAWFVWALCWLLMPGEPDSTGKALVRHKGKIPENVDIEF